MWQNRPLAFIRSSPEYLDVYCGMLHLSSPSSWFPMWPWASNSSVPQTAGHKIVLSSLTDLVYLHSILIRTDAVTYPVFVQQVAETLTLAGGHTWPTCCQKCQDVRNKNYANLSLISTSTLKNLKQYTKQFNNTSDMHGGMFFSMTFWIYV